MIKKLYEAGYLDYSKIILSNLKKLALTTNEALILIKILDNYPKIKSVSIENLQEELLLPISEIEEALSKLEERNFYEMYINYDNGKGTECTILDGFFTKVEALLNNELELENPSDEIFKINQLIQKYMNRILTSTEFEILSSLVTKDKYNYESFYNACEYLKDKKRNITMKTIAQALVVKEEPKANTAPSFVTDFFNSIK